MPTRTATLVATSIAIAALGAVDTDAAEVWVQVFSGGAQIETRDGRTYRLDDPADLVSAFRADGIDLPVDFNHATETLAPKGERADAVGWVRDLEVREGRLWAKLELLEAGRAALAARTYRYLSPAFWHDREHRITRLKSIALVTSPALAGQPALAGAGSHPPEIPMSKTIAVALGLAETADETACLAAITALKTPDPAAFVAKAIHDQTVATLAATTRDLETLRAEVRGRKVEAVIEAALTAKKILPAQKDAYVALCSTDAGLESVTKLLEAMPEQLAPSGLDAKNPDQAVAKLTAEQSAAAKATGVSEEEYLAALAEG